MTQQNRNTTKHIRHDHPLGYTICGITGGGFYTIPFMAKGYPDKDTCVDCLRILEEWVLVLKNDRRE